MVMTKVLPFKFSWIHLSYPIRFVPLMVFLFISSAKKIYNKEDNPRTRSIFSCTLLGAMDIGASSMIF